MRTLSTGGKELSPPNTPSAGPTGGHRKGGEEQEGLPGSQCPVLGGAQAQRLRELPGLPGSPERLRGLLSAGAGFDMTPHDCTLGPYPLQQERFCPVTTNSQRHPRASPWPRVSSVSRPALPSQERQQRSLVAGGTLEAAPKALGKPTPGLGLGSGPRSAVLPT